MSDLRRGGAASVRAPVLLRRGVRHQTRHGGRPGGADPAIAEPVQGVPWNHDRQPEAAGGVARHHRRHGALPHRPVRRPPDDGRADLGHRAGHAGHDAGGAPAGGSRGQGRERQADGARAPAGLRRLAAGPGRRAAGRHHRGLRQSARPAGVLLLQAAERADVPDRAAERAGQDHPGVPRRQGRLGAPGRARAAGHRPRRARPDGLGHGLHRVRPGVEPGRGRRDRSAHRRGPGRAPRRERARHRPAPTRSSRRPTSSRPPRRRRSSATSSRTCSGTSGA